MSTLRKFRDFLPAVVVVNHATRGTETKVTEDSRGKAHERVMQSGSMRVELSVARRDAPRRWLQGCHEPRDAQPFDEEAEARPVLTQDLRERGFSVPAGNWISRNPGPNADCDCRD